MEKRKTMLPVIIYVLHVLKLLSSFAEGGELSYSFYDQSCPLLQQIVRQKVQTLSLLDATTGAALVRLMFHDCQVEGCDASILLEGIYGNELDSKRNFGVRKREVIGIIKSAVEKVCPGQVSCADLIILAAREVVFLSGGPLIEVPLGRRDSSTPTSGSLADAQLPPGNLNVDEALSLFAGKGMSAEETVAIIGSHTLGVAHCNNVAPRLYKPLGERPTNLDLGYEYTLKLLCPVGSPLAEQTPVFMDPTAIIFDKTYFGNAIKGRAVLVADAEMPVDSRTAGFVQQFAFDQGAFYSAFSSAFVKLAASGVLTGDQGMIRTSCNALI